MGETTAISWADATVNFWMGCTALSPACDGCYARALVQDRFGKAEWGGPGHGAGTRTRTAAASWNLPFKLQRRAEKDGTRPFVFVNSLADIGDTAVPAEWRAEAFGVMRRTPRLVYLLLTKRPQNMVKLTEAAGGLPPNCALGTTVEDQQRAMNLFHLACAARDLKPLFTFASFEPLLGPVDPTRVVLHEGAAEFPDQPEIHAARFLFNALRGAASLGLPPLGWAITGGETDQGAHKARPTHPDWFRSLRDQCAAAGVPFHFKQWGEWGMPSADLGRLDWPYHPDHDRTHWFDQRDCARPIEPGWSDKYLLGGGAWPPPPFDMFKTPEFIDQVSRCAQASCRDAGRCTGNESRAAVTRVGKYRAGRLIDGVLHDARPAVPAMEAAHG
ncbi:DUF5131 family protein [Xanthobacter autotrophicus]|uniref:DUF5131 family protein n=1 Tax=Xanthobacter autotrophicus TaxID=280 RepID=UPI00372C9FE1